MSKDLYGDSGADMGGVSQLESDRVIFKLLHKYAAEIIEDHSNWSGRDNVPMITGRYAMKIKDAINAELSAHFYNPT